jgi:hypothetical protein
LGAIAEGEVRAAPLAQFHAPMRELVVRARTIDIRAYEIANVECIAAELQPSTLCLVREGRALLASILDRCTEFEPVVRLGDSTATPVPNAYLPFERAIDATMANIGSQEVVEEIAFIAQLELRQREDRLERIRASQGAVALLGECDSSLRRIRKALTAVDAAIAKVEHVAPSLDFTSELHTSLAVRRAYAKFRARVLAAGEPTPDTLRARFRGAGTQIALLVGWDIYPDMRVQDRLVLRDLQQRILEWLRGDDTATAASGLRLWQDLAGCIEMFSLVNRRQELVEHDSKLVRELWEAVDGPLPFEHALEAMRALEGLDRELDELLARASVDIAALRPILRRLTQQLGTGQPMGSAEVPW